MARVLGFVVVLSLGCGSERHEAETAAPEFPSQEGRRWLGGEATSIAKLRGHVVLVEAWSRH